MANDEPWLIRPDLWQRANRRAVPMRPAWRVLPGGDNGDVVHVLPPNDLVLHEPDDDCVCGPASRIVEGHDDCDHADIWIHVHHALDGRRPPRVR